MFVLPAEFDTLLATFAPLFSRRVWSHARLLIVGAILAPGKRTVTSALRAVGLAREQNFINYQRILNRAVWNTCFAAKVLLGILVAVLPPGFPLIVLVDETIERRNGKKIKTKGVFRDAVRSTRKQVVFCYGILKEVLAFSGTSLWHTPGMPPVLIRWVVVRDPQGVFQDTPILCTDLGAVMSQIIEWFVLRWNIEVFFEESRCHLGVESQRQWSDKAIGRTTPCMFGLFSLITVMAMRMADEGRLPISQTAWYRKEQATFSDVIALVRRQLWAARYFVDSSLQPKFAEFGDDLIKQLIDSLAQGALLAKVERRRLSERNAIYGNMENGRKTCIESAYQHLLIHI